MLFLSATAWNVSAQTVRWSDSFVATTKPTDDQCQRWNAFLNDLNGKQFSTVRIWGSNDPEGITLSDPAAVAELAGLLNRKQNGSVTVDGNTWSVMTCGSSICGGPSITLMVNGTGSCNCVADSYVIRPQSSNWGGLKIAGSCAGTSQTMNIEFGSGVSITADGSTQICKGEGVTLTASANACADPTFTWSTGEVGASIVVDEPGDYYAVLSGSGCSGISETISVTWNDVSVQAAASVEVSETAEQISDKEVTICDESVQLSAQGMSDMGSGSVSEKVCLFDQNGGDCSTFTNSLCVDRANPSTNFVLSHDFEAANPSKLRFNIYYGSRTTNGTFLFKVNGQEIGSFVETISTGSNCFPQEYPRTLEFPSEALTGWDSEGVNNVSIEFSAGSGDILLAGVNLEIEYSNDSYSWFPVEGLTNPNIANPIATPTETTTYVVTYKDASGCTTTDQVKINVQCAFPPVVKAKALTVPVGENCLAEVDASAFDDGSTSGSESELAFSVSPAGPYPVGTTTLLFTATDEDGLSSSCETTITVVNESPAITSVVPSTSDVYANLPVALAISYADNNISTATIDWGDGSEPQTVESPEALFEVSHRFVSAGSYSATITLTDECEVSTFVYESILVMDNLTGKVSGGGWFNSPRGAYTEDPRAVGKATFGFEASNTGRKKSPEGHVVFNFNNGNIKFRSTQLDWMHVEENAAMVQAEGKLNGQSGYQILISVMENDNDSDQGDDEYGEGERGKQKSKKDKKKDKKKGKDRDDKKGKKGIDYIRVRITDPTGKVIYDTQRGEADDADPNTELGGGSIKIEQSKVRFDREHDSPASSFGGESSSVFPNPFNEWIDVQYNSGSNEKVVIVVMDLSGRVVFNQVFDPSEDGRYSLDVFKEGESRPGIYIIVIKQGRKVEFLRAVAE